MTDKPAEIGVYIHIPFCAAVCHYCDFAKTANFHSGLVAQYFQALRSHLASWLNLAADKGLFTPGDVTSVFFGGGTPSLFGSEYEPLISLLEPWLSPKAEITIEANPDNISLNQLNLWKSLGFNRISVGVQTFSPQGLTALKRVHNATEASRSIELAAKIFERVSIDLIYGWPSQTEDQWLGDLKYALTLPFNHLSLYSLTYESRTPIGRAQIRGKIKAHSDDSLADFYSAAQTLLAAKDWHQYEVSNWSRRGFECKQNEIYWKGASYLGIGSGAAGYLAEQGPFGLRYQYPRNERGLKPITTDLSSQLLISEAGVVGLDKHYMIEVEIGRSERDWLFERIGSSLRCQWGFSISEAEQKLKRKFSITPNIACGLERGSVLIQSGLEDRKQNNSHKSLILRHDQWFLEQSWAQEVIKGFGI